MLDDCCHQNQGQINRLLDQVQFFFITILIHLGNGLSQYIFIQNHHVIYVIQNYHVILNPFAEYSLQSTLCKNAL